MNGLLRKSLFSYILPDYREPQQCNTANSEVKIYINEEGNIYNYWSKSQLKELQYFAIRYHSNPSSSVDSDRVFSTAGLICFKSRNAIHPEKVRHLIFLLKNIKYIE